MSLILWLSADSAQLFEGLTLDNISSPDIPEPLVLEAQSVSPSLPHKIIGAALRPESGKGVRNGGG